MLVLLRCDDVSPTAPVRPTGFCVAINFIISLSLSPKTDRVGKLELIRRLPDQDRNRAVSAQDTAGW